MRGTSGGEESEPEIMKHLVSFQRGESFSFRCQMNSQMYHNQNLSWKKPDRHSLQMRGGLNNAEARDTESLVSKGHTLPHSFSEHYES